MIDKIKEIIKYLSTNESELLVSVVVNLFSDVISCFISKRDLKRKISKFKKELRRWVINYQNENIDTVLVKESFSRYLDNFNVIENVYSYIFDETQRVVTEEEFLIEITSEIIAYMKEKENSFDFKDEQVVRSFIMKLFNKVNDFIDSTDSMELTSLLYKTNQLRLGNKRIFEMIKNQSALTEKSMLHIEELFNQAIDKIENNAPVLNEEWFEKQNRLSINNLGDRYMPDLNVDLDISNNFNIIAGNKTFFSEFKAVVNETLIAMNTVASTDDIIALMKKDIIDVLESINEFEEWVGNRDKLIELLLQIREHADYQYNLLVAAKKNGENVYQETINKYRKIVVDIDTSISYMQEKNKKLVEYPYLVIYGKGGIGKSHLLANQVETRINNNELSIFLLGQDFPENCIIWKRFSDLLELDQPIDYILNQFNNLAIKKHSRILFFIDAINEGGGRTLWKNHLPSVITRISTYKSLGLVFSVRSDFFEEIIHRDTIRKYQITTIEHTGFNELTPEAIRKFFAHYEIEISILPYFPKEFSNPLFLKLFCEGYQKDTNRLGGLNTGQIYHNYIVTLNKKMSEEFNYSESINLVYEIIVQLVLATYSANSRNKIDKNAAQTIIFNTLKNYQVPTRMFDKLLAEGVLANGIDNDGEYIYVTYERLADYIYAKYILDRYMENEAERNAVIKLMEMPGVREEFAGMFPINGKELFEVFPEIKEKRSTMYAFASSVSWREDEGFGKKETIDYVNKYIMKDDELYKSFIHNIVCVSTNERHKYNAEFLHEYLLGIPMAYRDAKYMEIFNDWNHSHSPIYHLINWIDEMLKNNKYIDDKTVYLSALTLSWMLICTDMEFRDTISMKLCHLLRGRITILINLLKAFEQVDDAYVIERLYAIAFGVEVFEKDYNQIQLLSRYIYQTVFVCNRVISDILIYDSARNIIMYANSICNDSEVDLQTINRVSFIDISTIPTDEEINKYKQEYDRKDRKDIYIAQNKILSSMQVDDRNHMYGDFGRYTFQHYFNDWKQLDASDLMKIAIKDIFDRGYNAELHGAFDYGIRDYMRIAERKIERIGKKYQWQALYQLAAQVSNQFPKKSETTGEEYYNKGAYEPNLRNFDPTINTINKIKGKFGELPEITYNGFELPDKEWIHTIHDLPDSTKMLAMDIQNDTFCLLHGTFRWTEEMPLGVKEYECALKEVWFMAQACIVREEDFEKCKKELSNANFWGRWMPEATENYSMYNREYYWSDAQEFYNCDYYGGNEWKRVWRGDNKKIASVDFLVPVYLYFATGEIDIPELSYHSWYKPCKTLYKGLGLHYEEENTVLYDSDNNMICFDTMEVFGKDIGFYIKQQTLEQFLKDNHYRIIWSLLGEKRKVGNDFRNRNDDDLVSPDYSGFFYLENGEIKGDIKLFAKY